MWLGQKPCNYLVVCNYDPKPCNFSIFQLCNFLFTQWREQFNHVFIFFFFFCIKKCGDSIPLTQKEKCPKMHSKNRSFLSGNFQDLSHFYVQKILPKFCPLAVITLQYVVQLLCKKQGKQPIWWFSKFINIGIYWSLQNMPPNMN